MHGAINMKTRYVCRFQFGGSLSLPPSQPHKAASKRTALVAAVKNQISSAVAKARVLKIAAPFL